MDMTLLFAVALVVVAMPFWAMKPKYLVYLFLGLIFFFPNPGWGVLDKANIFNLYSKGTGQLPVSLMTLFLWGMFLIVFVFANARSDALRWCNLRKYFWAFNALFAVYALFGVVIGNPIEKVLTEHGVITVFNMSLLVVVMLRIFKKKEDAEQLMSFLLLCVVTRGIYGIFRFVFQGGDPANVYANVEHIAVRLTFFDIGDLLVACMAAFYAGWMLLWKGRQVSFKGKLFYAFVLGVELFVIIFSYRRTAWGGLVLAGIPFVMLQPWRRRIQIALALAVLSMFTFTVVMRERLQGVAKGKGLLEMFFYDTATKGKLSADQGRLAELNAAFQTVKENMLFGVGPWGGYGPYSIDFMHSGFLHVWLKTGLLGLVIFVAMLVGYVLFCTFRRRTIPPVERGYFEAGFAGFLFLLPTLFMGTPIIEFRTMQLLGLVLVLPYIAYAIQRRSQIPLAPSLAHGARP